MTAVQSTTTYNRQYRRMQFVLAPRPVAAPAGWVLTPVSGGLCLTSHPDLNVLSVEGEDVSLTLLGYMLDSEAPEASDADILTRLAADWSANADPFALLDPLGGRYLLIARYAGETSVVGDANGTLQLYFATSGGETWCAAQPDLLAQHLGSSADAEAIDYIERLKANSFEYAWVLDSTPYAHVRRLLPNHYLELGSAAVHRYWPRGPLASRTVDEVKGPAAKRLAALMTAAANRFDLAVGVSAGLDSRLMLAASRSVKDQVVYYTGQDEHRTARHPDVSIPRRMLAKLGVEHHVIEAAEALDPEFAATYRASVPYAHECRLPDLQAQWERYQFARVAAIGNVSENARAFYQAETGLPDFGFTAQELADGRGVGHLDFYVRRLQEHLDRLGDTHGVSHLDLLMWEHDSGAWFAGNIGEFLSAWQDVFLPYNCRALLTELMAAPVASRMVPATELYCAVAEELWPEVLAHPINPLTPSKWFYKHVYPLLRAAKRTLLSLLGRNSGSGSDAAAEARTRHGRPGEGAAGPASSNPHD